MKLFAFRREDAQQLGALAGDGDTVVALAAASQACDGRPALGSGSLLELLDVGPTAIEQAARLMEWATGPDARRASPCRSPTSICLALIPRPPSLRDAMTFETHVINSFRSGTLRRLAPLDAALERALRDRRSLTHVLVRGFQPRAAPSAGAAVRDSTADAAPVKEDGGRGQLRSENRARGV